MFQFSTAFVLCRTVVLGFNSIRQPDVQERFSTQGLDAVGSTPEVLAALIKQETVMYAKLVKQIGLQPQ